MNTHAHVRTHTHRHLRLRHIAAKLWKEEGGGRSQRPVFGGREKETEGAKWISCDRMEMTKTCFLLPFLALCFTFY